MNEPLYLQLKIAHDKLLDVATREIKDHQLIAERAAEVSAIALGISNRERKLDNRSPQDERKMR